MVGPLEDQRIEVRSGADGHPDVQVVRRTDEGKRVGAAVEHYFNSVDGKRVTVANLVALLALMFVCWPARKPGRRAGAATNRPVAVHQPFGNVVQRDAAPAADPGDLRPNQA